MGVILNVSCTENYSFASKHSFFLIPFLKISQYFYKRKPRQIYWKIAGEIIFISLIKYYEEARFWEKKIKKSSYYSMGFFFPNVWLDKSIYDFPYRSDETASSFTFQSRNWMGEFCKKRRQKKKNEIKVRGASYSYKYLLELPWKEEYSQLTVASCLTNKFWPFYCGNKSLHSGMMGKISNAFVTEYWLHNTSSCLFRCAPANNSSSTNPRSGTPMQAELAPINVRGKLDLMSLGMLPERCVRHCAAPAPRGTRTETAGGAGTEGRFALPPLAPATSK